MIDFVISHNFFPKVGYSILTSIGVAELWLKFPLVQLIPHWCFYICTKHFESLSRHMWFLVNKKKDSNKSFVKKSYCKCD